MLPLSGLSSNTITLCLPNSICYALRLQAFCNNVLQQRVEEMPLYLRIRALPRIAMRYYWLQAHGHRITPKLGFAMLSPARFAANYGSTEEAIEQWRQHWLQTPEGRLYGCDGADSGVGG